jgi:hypothetical protein
MTRRHKRQPIDFDYLDGYLSAFEDFPDGAWQAACEEAIGANSKFAGRDPYDVWIAWVAHNATRGESSK